MTASNLKARYSSCARQRMSSTPWPLTMTWRVGRSGSHFVLAPCETIPTLSVPRRRKRPSFIASKDVLRQRPPYEDSLLRLVDYIILGQTVTQPTYRSLLKALARRGHRIHFIEKDVEWYRNNRDMPEPSFGTVKLYERWERDSTSMLAASADADVIVIGSYFPDAIRAAEALFSSRNCPILFYDIDTPITARRAESQWRNRLPERQLDSSFLRLP